MLYSTMVKRRVRATFAALSDGDASVMLDSLAPEFRYRFHGDHALGGTRRTRASMEAWWERVFRLLPGHRFHVEEIILEGGPWRTRLAARVTVRGDLPDGSAYDNMMLQLMTLRWGRVVEIETLEDLQELQRALAVSAAHGVAQATAPPIQDFETLPS